MKIIQSILTKNPCYTANKKIAVKGLMLHSVGCPQPNAQAFIDSWNTANFDDACVHAFIDAETGDIYQTLPWNFRGWHAGLGQISSANNTHIGIEMCEPDCIKYTGEANFICSDEVKAKTMVRKTYESAVELFAFLCKEYNLNPLESGVIISHKEGYTRGIASNHGDPEHLWKTLNLPYSMTGFRYDVKSAMSKEAKKEEPAQIELPKTPFEIQVLVDNLNYYSLPLKSSLVKGQTKKGVFTINEVKGNWGKLKSGAGWVNLEDSTKVKIKKEVQVKETSFKVKVTASALHIRSGPGTQYKSNGIIRDKGTYTIVGKQNGFGKLKSGKGWICLEYTRQV